MGDVPAMVARVLEILRMTESEYSVLSETSRRVADRFRWEKIAADTIDEYVASLARLRPLTRRPGTEAVSA